MAVLERDITKLPRWAQSEISKLRADAEFHQKRAAEILGEIETPVEINPPYELGARRMFIASRSRVRYTLPNGHKIDVSLSERGEVSLYTSIGRIAVMPSASNVATATVLDS